MTYDGLGRLSVTAVTPGTGADTYYEKQTYDAYGRPHQHFDAARTSKLWDDNVTEVKYNEFGYAHKWVDGVYENGAPRATYRQITAQDARGNVTGEKLGGGALRTTRGFDAKTGRMTGITSTTSLGSERQALGYTWDVLGNLTERRDTTGETRDLTETFTYDTLNRLTTYQLGDNTAVTVTYDALGNIKKKSDVGSYIYGIGSAGPHAVSFAGGDNFTYDANGNVVRESRDGTFARSLSYTPFNKVKSIEKGNHKVSFAYGPERARYKRVDTDNNGTKMDTSDDTTTTTLYVGSVEKVTHSDSLYAYKRYIAGGVALITEKHETTTGTDGTPAVTETVTTEYLLKDHLGSVSAITNSLGTIVQELSYDPWGQRRVADTWQALSRLSLMNFDTSRTTRGYTGHEMVDAVGIVHMNGRIYDPRLGRFLQADPIVQLPNYSQSWNRYSYVINNPLAYTDPSGHIFFTAAAVVGLVAFKVKTVIVIATVIGAAAFADALVQGVPVGQAFLAGVSAAALAAVSVGTFPKPVHGGFGWNLATARHVVTVAAAGGITTSLQGGKFGHGFISAGVGASVGGIPGLRELSPGRVAARTVVSAVTAGTVSEITGGKFANGAMTAAFFSLVSSAAQASTQRNFIYEGISPTEFEARTGMTFEESRFEYESTTGKPFPLTKQDALRLFTDATFANIQLKANENLHIDYRNILNMNAVKTIAAASAAGYERQPWYKNLFHNPLQNTKWVGPNGHLEVVFGSQGELVTGSPYEGTFNFFSPDNVSGHSAADVAPYLGR